MLHHVLGGIYTKTFFINPLSNRFFARGRFTASTQFCEHFKNDDRIGGVHTMNYCALDNRVTRIHVYAFEGNDTFQKEAEGQKDFIFTDDESE